MPSAAAECGTVTAMTYARGVAAAVVSLPAAALAAAWLVGDQSSAGEMTDLDFALRPLDVAEGVQVGAGVAGLAVLGLGAVVVARGAPRAWPVLACLAAAGLLVGGGYRVITAGGIGANIGAGLVVLIGGPLLLGLLLVAAVLAVKGRPGRA